jgi:hypothetical protein
MSDPAPEDEGYTEWREALGTDDQYYVECDNGHGSLPPRRVCPQCGSRELTEEPLPATGTVETFTVVHIGPPRFAEDVPYVTAVASFGPVRVTGVLRGMDPEAVETGATVSPTVEETETGGDPLVVFRPADEA